MISKAAQQAVKNGDPSMADDILCRDILRQFRGKELSREDLEAELAAAELGAKEAMERVTSVERDL